VEFEEIKKIIEIEGGKFIIVEEGKPVMVILSFEDYKKRIKGLDQPKPQKAQTEKTQKTLPPELANYELKIEDLPF